MKFADLKPGDRFFLADKDHEVRFTGVLRMDGGASLDLVAGMPRSPWVGMSAEELADLVDGAVYDVGVIGTAV